MKGNVPLETASKHVQLRDCLYQTWQKVPFHKSIVSKKPDNYVGTAIDRLHMTSKYITIALFDSQVSLRHATDSLAAQGIDFQVAHDQIVVHDWLIENSSCATRLLVREFELQRAIECLNESIEGPVHFVSDTITEEELERQSLEFNTDEATEDLNQAEENEFPS